MPPRPPRVNQSQIYNNGISGGADTNSVSGTPGGSNYRKVFKPNIQPRSATNENEHDSNDSVDRANALALGQTPTQSQRNNKGFGGYEPSASSLRQAQ